MKISPESDATRPAMVGIVAFEIPAAISRALDDPVTAMDESFWEYGIEDWERSTMLVVQRRWLLGRGDDTDGTELIVASAEVDGVPVIVELWGHEGEVDTLMATVLEPALRSMRVESGS